MDLGVVLHGEQQVVEGLVGPRSANAAKVRSAASMSLRRTASRRTSPPGSPGKAAGRHRVEDFVATAAAFLDAVGCCGTGP